MISCRPDRIEAIVGQLNGTLAWQMPSRYYLRMASDDNPREGSVWVQLARYSQLAFVLPAATVAGLLLGVGLDRWLHTQCLYLVGLILGIVAGFIELIRTVVSTKSE